MLRRIFAGIFAATALFAQTGTAVPELAELDSITQGLMSKWQVPGASVAVAVEGRLVYARSFGVTDRGQTTPVTPDSLFSNGVPEQATYGAGSFEAGGAGKATPG